MLVRSLWEYGEDIEGLSPVRVLSGKVYAPNPMMDIPAFINFILSRLYNRF